jgi:SAM-dependent methyltransferase
MKRLDKCLCCDSSKLVKILDLNEQPLANSYLKTQDEVEETFPLAINFCGVCTHIQLTHAVDPDLLFKNYLYVSGTSNTLRDYFKEFVSITKRYTDGKVVLDIACNDGSQLDAFKEAGYETHGIDPAENLYELSSKNHEVICDYYSDSILENKKEYYYKFDVVIAQNVFAHNSYPKEFLETCKKMMKHDGVLFVQTSQADMVKNNQFDTIYHEHISFFSIRSMEYLARRAGLYVKDIIKTPVHGNSFVFVLSKWGPDQSRQFQTREGTLDTTAMIQYALHCRRIAEDTAQLISDLQQRGHRVVGYGAAAKGNTFLNFSEFKLDYIVDDNPLKHGLYTPGSRIPIVSPDKLKEEKDSFYIVPLAWNFFDEIKTKVSGLTNTSVKYIRYFPNVEIVYA